MFLAFAVFSAFIIARRFMCNSCYYCKSCTKVTAKLSIMLLGGNNIPGLGRGTIVGLDIFLYVVLTVIPSALIASSLVQTFKILNISILAALLMVTVITIALKIKKGNKLITS